MKRLSGFPNDVVTLLTLAQVLQVGRCHSIPTEFAAHPRHTSMELSISEGATNFEKIAIRISGGRRPIGGSGSDVSLGKRESRKLATPMEDCESLAWAMKKSVSSSAARSGDVDPEVSEGAALEHRPASRSRCILVGVGSLFEVRFNIFFGCRYG